MTICVPRYKTDGLSSLNYTLLSKDSESLYTNITVKLVKPGKDKKSETKAKIENKLNLKPDTNKKNNPKLVPKTGPQQNKQESGNRKNIEPKSSYG